MQKLDPEHKQFIVQRLACFVSPTEVAKELKDVYGLTVTTSVIAAYDPGTAQSKKTSDEFKTLFLKTRKRFIESETDVALSHRNYRLQRLYGLLEHPLVKQSPKLALLVLEQAAKEMGGLFLRQEKLDPRDLTDDQIVRILEGKAQSRGQTPETADPGR